jgi:repressor LexA
MVAKLINFYKKGEFMINHEKIAELIRAKGIEQKALAEEVGVSEAMMSFIVRGLKEPSLTVLTRIAKALDVPVAELIIE